MEVQTQSAQVTPPPTFPVNPAAPAATPIEATPNPAVSTPANPAEPPPAGTPPPTDPPTPEPERVVPDRYELKAPDGSFLDQKSLERIESYAKTNKLTQAEASELVKTQDEDVRAVMDERRNAWLEETKNDREIGGANLQRNVEVARTFLDRHMAPELRQELDRTGYGNNRHFMKFVLDMAKRSANDSVVMPGQQSPQSSDRSIADMFYAETTSKGK